MYSEIFLSLIFYYMHSAKFSITLYKQKSQKHINCNTNILKVKLFMYKQCDYVFAWRQILKLHS